MNRESEIERRGMLCVYAKEKGMRGSVKREEKTCVLSLCLCLSGFVYFKDKYRVLTPKKSTGFCFGEKKVFLFLFFKYCADVEKCGRFKGLGFIYIYKILC